MNSYSHSDIDLISLPSWISYTKKWITVCFIWFAIDYLVDEEIRKSQLERKLENGDIVAFGEKYQGQFDRDLYGAVDKGIDCAVVVNN